MPDTRHSVGMVAVDRLVEQFGGTWTKQSKLSGFFSGPVMKGNMELYFLKPKLAMNLSGKSVSKAGRKASNQPEAWNEFANTSL